jgi:hypothetical protein
MPAIAGNLFKFVMRGCNFIFARQCEDGEKTLVSQIRPMIILHAKKISADSVDAIR